MEHIRQGPDEFYQVFCINVINSNAIEGALQGFFKYNTGANMSGMLREAL